MIRDSYKERVVVHLLQFTDFKAPDLIVLPHKFVKFLTGSAVENFIVLLLMHVCMCEGFNWVFGRKLIGSELNRDSHKELRLIRYHCFAYWVFPAGFVFLRSKTGGMWAESTLEFRRQQLLESSNF